MSRTRDLGRAVGWICLLAAAALSVFSLGKSLIGTGQDELERIVQRWFVAVHEEDFETLARYDATAPAARQGRAFETWRRQVLGILYRYESQRESGLFEPDEQGYKLTRAVMLGRGAYWDTLELLKDGPDRVLRIRVNFGYGGIPYGSLPRGTVVYLLGYPLGTIYSIELGTGREYELDVLEHLVLDVRLERVEDRVSGDALYQVAGISWLPERAVHEEVSWYF
jgi:hypothetical protein